MSRDPLEIMEEILGTLEKKGRALSLNEIAQETGIHNVTVRKYVRIIERIRQEPTVEVIRTNHSIIVRVINRPVRERRVEVYEG